MEVRMRNPTKAIPLPKLRSEVINRPYEEITVEKEMDDFVLLFRSLVIKTNILQNNEIWRFKTFESFKDKTMQVSDDRGVYFEDVEIPIPSDKLVKDLEGYSEILFVAKIPHNTNMKRLH